MSVDERVYYLRRADEELAAAERSPSPEAAEAHREMHARYMAMVEQGSGKTAAKKPGTVSIGS